MQPSYAIKLHAYGHDKKTSVLPFQVLRNFRLVHGLDIPFLFVYPITRYALCILSAFQNKHKLPRKQ